VAAGAGNDVTLNTAGNDFSTVSVSSGNNVTLVDAAGIDLGASTVSGNLAVTATTGNITNSGAVAVTGTSTFTADAAGASISVNNGGNSLGDAVAFAGVGGLANVTVTDTNALDLQVLTLTGNLNVTTTGPITDSGNLVIGGTTTLAAGMANDVVLDQAGNDFSTVSTTSGNNVTLVDATAIDLGDFNIAGDLCVTAGGAITDSGTLVVQGTTKVTAGAGNNVTLDTVSNDFNSIGINSGNNVTLVDINNIDLATSTISGNLNVTAPNGLITQSGILIVAGTQSLNDSSSSQGGGGGGGGNSNSEASPVEKNAAVKSAQVASTSTFNESLTDDGGIPMAPNESSLVLRQGEGHSRTVSHRESSLLFEGGGRSSPGGPNEPDGFSQFFQSLWESLFSESDDEDEESEEGKNEEQSETSTYFKINTI
jgi:hypothetical protein